MSASSPVANLRRSKKTACAVEPQLDSRAPLEPLLRRLAENRPASQVERFPRGTLLPDGRLDLCKQGIGPTYAKDVASALRSEQHVRALLLGADHLGLAGVRAIAAGEGERRRLTALYLGCNAMGEAGAGVLADHLGGHPTLRGLWIKRNEIGRGARAVASLARSLPHLRTLDLACNGIDLSALEDVVDAALERGLEALFVCGNGLGPRGGAVLARLLGAGSRLRVLIASANDLGDQGTAAIARALETNTSLAILGLASNAIGEAGARALARAIAVHPALARLELGCAAATEVLGATPNRIGDEGASHFAAALRENPCLEALDVSHNGIGEEGARRLARAATVGAERLVSLDLGGDAPPDVRTSLVAALCTRKNRARARGGDEDFRADVALVKSVYRTASGGSLARMDTPGAARHEAPIRCLGNDLPPPRITPAELGAAARVAEAIGRGEVAVPVELRAAFVGAGRRLARLARSPWTRERARARRLLVDGTGIRQLRRVESQGGEDAQGHPTGRTSTPPADAPSARAPVPLDRPRRCYICKETYRELDWFYDQLCPACAEASRAKRNQTADMRGRIALVTGARTKIGHQTALKLLRAGATVIGTTRFPFDAAARFAAAPDFAGFAERLVLYALDLRFLSAVERLAAEVDQRFGCLDILVHNAAQTIARPAEYYRELSAREAQARSALPPASPEDRRTSNSWRLALGEVPMGEAVSVHVVNALAPLALTQALLPSLRRRRHADAFLVAASAVEGQFGRPFKTPYHPHTNMAKAALNMMIRTSAGALAAERIFATAVDTGWITNENPYRMTAAMEIRGFEPPLDEIEGAARLCDPIFSVLNGGPPAYGVFLKDYRAAAW
jgi:NAD(P)-dependent dehydrogenase (short-subunit alcohol dehydrogenase family)/Ran GTPase-activating protein (RanGAP) involved in mRNA processing and transport